MSSEDPNTTAESLASDKEAMMAWDTVDKLVEQCVELDETRIRLNEEYKATHTTVFQLPITDRSDATQKRSRLVTICKERIETYQSFTGVMKSLCHHFGLLRSRPELGVEDKQKLDRQSLMFQSTLRNYDHILAGLQTDLSEAELLVPADPQAVESGQGSKQD